jgi:nucleoside-diphosphate-sugar epimerase
VHFLCNPHPDWPPERPLRRYDRVRCLVAPGAPETALDEVEVVRGDLRDRGAVARFIRDGEGADLFHFAGVVHPRRVPELYEVNAEATGTLLADAGRSGVSRVIALSSNSAVGVSRDPGTVFDEATPCRPYLAYGRSKLAMEEAVGAYAGGSVILRPCWFYGPGQPDRQTMFMQMVKSGRAPLVGGGEARRSLTYVDAIALAALLAADEPAAAGQTYWIADPEPYPMHAIVDTIEAVLRDDFGMSVSGRRVRLPRLASDAARAADTSLQRVGLYLPKVHVLGEMSETIACSPAKARRELGWSPGPGLREGMRRSVQWCLDEGIAL